MWIDARTEAYLQGKVISNGELFHVKKSPVISRNNLLVALATDKSILHLGCADHLDLIRRKREAGRYLHDMLVKSAEKVVGADTNRRALHEMQTLGFKELYHVNDIPDDIAFDYVMVPDVIEHVDDVGTFLTALREYRACKIIITTPNAYRLRNRKMFSSELINTDHRYWFSPYTLAKTLYEAGFVIEKYYFTDKYSFYRPFSAYLKWRYPLCRDGLAVIARWHR